MVRRLLRSPVVLAWILWHVVTSTLQIARGALTPGPVGEPCLVRYPMRSRTDVEVTALAWAITVTPGTLTVAIGETDMWVHVLFGGERDDVLAMLSDIEDRTLSVLRGGPS